MKRKCPICESDNKKLMFEINFDFSDSCLLPKCNRIVYCNACGFAFADNDAVQGDYDEYYKQNNSYVFSDELKYSKTKHAIKYTGLYINIIRDYLSSEETIVDVGCGDGELLLDLKQMGYNKLTGIDPSEFAIEALRKKGINGIASSVFNIYSLGLSKYSMVISTGVAEHIYNLDAYVDNLKSLLVDSGKLFVVVPAVEGFSKKESSLPNYFNHEHINYFSRISLDNMMAKHGLKNICDRRYFNDTNGEILLVGIYQKDSFGPYSMVYDDLSIKSIDKFMESQNIRKNKNKEIFENLKEQDFILWGTGSMALQFVAEYKALKKRIRYCVDNNPGKWGTLFSGIRVENPDKLKEGIYMPILICSMLNAEDIIEQIDRMGLENSYYMCN